MGGAVPLGYRVEDRALHVVEDEAEFVRALFRRYLEVGSRLKIALDAENLRSPVRMSRTGRRTGGGLMSRGHLYWILSNPIYVGRLRHKGQVHDGLHPAIIDLGDLGPGPATGADGPRTTGSMRRRSPRSKRRYGRATPISARRCCPYENAKRHSIINRPMTEIAQAAVRT
jgi:Recombinase